MTNTLRVALAQLNFLVGDIEGNTEKIIQNTLLARDTHHANLIVFPELALTGYPPEDLLYRPDLYERISDVLPRIYTQAVGIDIIVGYPAHTLTGRYNRAGFISNQQLIQHYDKQKLPNYSVFDERRYFRPGSPSACIINVRGIKIAIIICEDIWYPEPSLQAKIAGADLVVSLNASPFTKDKAVFRHHKVIKRVQETALPMLYLNCVGGQDELVFDGGSMIFDDHAKIIHQAAFFEETLLIVDIEKNAQNHLQIKPIPSPLRTDQHKNGLLPIFKKNDTEEACIYHALVFGLREYIEKNHFPRAIVGLSGGIDSALTLAIAVDAIGHDRVQAIMMPSRYSAVISLIDAKLMSEIMGVTYEILSIEPVFQAFLQTLHPLFKDLPEDTTEENLQARCRGTLLMAISNKKQAIVLATGNKSETAVGYSTLYGDMVGGFCVLKDVFKTMVYKLAQYRNTLSPVIPERILQRPPSAELAPDQKDEDSLPPYPILDEILTRYIERDESLQTIIQAGFDKAAVCSVVQMVDHNEYKRRQAAPGIRISERAFGKDRRYPITSGFKPFLVKSK